MKRPLLALTALVAAAGGGWWVGGHGRTDAPRRSEASIGELPGAAPLPAIPAGPVRNVVLLVGDGLGVTQATVARLRSFGPQGRFHFERFPVTGLLTTHASDDLVTDSAAAATAIASGTRTAYRRTGTDTGGRPLRTLIELARDAGLRTGVVTSTEVVDATPAAFLAHVDSRAERQAIADQIAASRVDLLAGGGRGWFQPDAAGGRRRDGRDLLAAARAGGVVEADSAAGLAAAATLPAWALFDAENLGEEPVRPTVGELTAAALDRLARATGESGPGFLLVAEEEAIDSAAHNADLERMTRAVRRFDEAAAAAARFAAARGDTLVLVVADHSTGGLVILPDSDARTVRVAWTTGNHAGEPVAVYAYGPEPAAARFTGLREITDIHDLIAAALGLETAAAPVSP